MADQEIKLKINADPSGGIAGVNQFSNRLKKLEGESGSIMSRVKEHWLGFAAAIGGTIAISKIAEFGKRAVDTADRLNKLSQSTGTTVEQFSGYVYAADLADVSQEALGTGLAKLSRNMLDAAADTGEAKDAFQAMGISVKNADGTLKNAGQVLEEVADKFASYEDGAAKTALAMKIFGRAGADMIPLLNTGAEGIRRAADEAKTFGKVLDKETAQSAEEFNDNIRRLTSMAEGFANSVMRRVLPAMEEYTDRMVKSAKETDAIERAASSAGEALVSMAQKAEMIVSLTSKVPPQFLEAGAYGLIGMVLFGGKAGAIIASLTVINDLASKSMNFGAQDFAAKWKGYTQSVQNILDVVSGRRDWNTGQWKPGYGPEAIGVDYEPHTVADPGKKTPAPLLAGEGAKKLADDYKNATSALASFQERVASMDQALTQWQKQEVALVATAADLLEKYKQFPEVVTAVQATLAEGKGYITLDRELAAQREAAEKSRQILRDRAEWEVELTDRTAGELDRRLSDEDRWVEQMRLKLIDWVQSVEEYERRMVDVVETSEKKKRQAREESAITMSLMAASLQEGSVDLAGIKGMSDQSQLELKVRIYEELLKQESAYLASLTAGSEAWMSQLLVMQDIEIKLAALEQAAKRYSGSFGDGMDQGFRDFQKSMKTAYDLGKEMTFESATAMRDGFKDIFFKAMKGEIRDMEDVFKSLGDMANDILDIIYKKIAELAANWLITQIFGGFGLPGFAGGGDFPAFQPFIAGEQGPELILPDRPGYVMNNADTMRAIASQSPGQTLSISVPVTIANDDHRLAARLQRNIEDTVRRTIKEAL